MVSEEQLAALFARANPVPSLDLLDPIEPVDVELLRSRSRSPELKTQQPPRPKTWLAPAAATVGVLIAAVSIFINVTPFASPAESAASTFMAALNDHDGVAIRGMYALEDQELKWNPDHWVAVTRFNQALGFEYTDVDCVERPPISYAGTEATRIECSWLLQADLTNALGLGATEGMHTVFTSDEGIVRVLETWSDPSSMDRSFAEFRAWVELNHPGDSWTMFRDPTDYRLPLVYANSHASAEPEALGLWDRYVDEFVAEHRG